MTYRALSQCCLSAAAPTRCDNRGGRAVCQGAWPGVSGDICQDGPQCRRGKSMLPLQVSAQPACSHGAWLVSVPSDIAAFCCSLCLTGCMMDCRPSSTQHGRSMRRLSRASLTYRTRSVRIKPSATLALGHLLRLVLPYMPRLDIDMQVMTDQGVQSSLLQPEPAERRTEHPRSKTSDVVTRMMRALQSYGIKVGYGAGGQAGNTVRPGEAAPAKSSSCC